MEISSLNVDWFHAQGSFIVNGSVPLPILPSASTGKPLLMMVLRYIDRRINSPLIYVKMFD
jgi:hypothetical protein